MISPPAPVEAGLAVKGGGQKIRTEMFRFLAEIPEGKIIHRGITHK